MKIQQEIIETTQQTLGFICDKCGLKTMRHDYQFEYQEFTTVRINGGYGSVFGDGDSWECDLCQRCLKELVGKYMKLIGSV